MALNDPTPFRSVTPNRLPFEADPRDPRLIRLCRRIVHECQAYWITGETGAVARVLSRREVDSLTGEDYDEIPGAAAGADAFEHGVTLFDMQTAVAVVQVYDNLNAENRVRWMTLHPHTVGRTAWKIRSRLAEERKAVSK